MSIVDYLSHSIFSQDSASGFKIAGVLFLLLTLRAIVQLKKTKLILDFFKQPKTIGQLILICAWCYLIYSYIKKNKHSKDEKTLEKKEVAISNITSNLGSFITKLAEHDADNTMITPETSDSSDSETQEGRVVIDIKDKVAETKARLLPVDVSSQKEEDDDVVEDTSGNDV